MYAYMKIIFSIFFLFFSSLVFAERSSLGFIGDSCSSFLDMDQRFSDEEFKDIFGVSEVRGFLTGANVFYFMLTDNLKIIDVDSAEEVFDFLVTSCRMKPDEDVFFIMTEYFYSLPEADL